jgi:hypothetical protein
LISNVLGVGTRWYMITITIGETLSGIINKRQNDCLQVLMM